MRLLRLSVAAMLVWVPTATPAVLTAQETAAAEPVDSEEALDEALKRFGHLAGRARVCVADEQRAELERDVMNVNASIARLLGVDRAFLFAASFGYGTSVEVEQKDCAEVLRNYAARVARHRAAEGGAQ